MEQQSQRSLANGLTAKRKREGKKKRHEKMSGDGNDSEGEGGGASRELPKIGENHAPTTWHTPIPSC